MDLLASDAMPEKIAYAAKQTSSRSIAFTYNEPIIFMEYAIDIAQICREQGIRTIAVTAGYIHPKPAVEFFSSIDATNVDLKAFTEKFYHKLTGAHL